MKLKLYRSSCEKCKEKGSETGISTDAIHLEETRSEFPTVLCYIESTGMMAGGENISIFNITIIIS